MRTNRTLFLTAAVAFALTSLVSVERGPEGQARVGIGATAEAFRIRCCRIRFPRIRLPRIRLPRISLPRIRLPPVIRNIGRAIGRAVGGVARAVGSVAHTVGKNLAKGVKAVGGGIVKIGRGVVQVAKGVGQVAVGVAKGAVKFTGGLVKGAGKLIKGDLKGALNEVKSGAKSGFAEVKKGAKEGIKNIAAGAGKIVTGALEVTKGLAQIALPFVNLDMVIEKVKKVIVGLLQKVVQPILSGKLGGIFGSILGAIAPDIKRAVDTIRGLIEIGQKILDVITNPDEYLHRGREWAINKLTDLAYNFAVEPLKKLAGSLAGFAVKMLKHFVTTPLTGMVTAALASVTFGIGAAVAPLIKMAIDKLMDWAIDQVKDFLGGLVMKIEFVRNFLRDKVIGPVINGLYDKIIGFIKKKFPRIASNITTSKERAEGVVANPLFEKQLGGLKAGLKKADELLSRVPTSKEAAKELAKELGAKVANKIVAEATKVIAPKVEPPKIVPTPQAAEKVLASLGGNASQEATVQSSDDAEQAPVVQPNPEAGLEGMRTAFKALYALLVQDWRSGLIAANRFKKVAPQRLADDILTTVQKALTSYRNVVHNAFRLLYSVRVLQLRAVYEKGAERHAERVTELLAAEAGQGAVVDESLEGQHLIEKPFDDAKAALSRLAQNGERFLNAGIEVFGAARKKLIRRVARTFATRVAQAKKALTDIAQKINEAAAEEATGEEAEQSAEGSR